MSAEGTVITRQAGRLVVPDDPIIPFIEGDGIGPDIWSATQRVLDAAVERSYEGRRRLVWKEVLAGEKAFERTGEWLPEATLAAAREHAVAIKGPLTTPVGGGIRSLNVAIRQLLDLYACVRPVRWVRGVGSPVKSPEKVNWIIFRENTEDVYSGVEFQSGSPEARKLFEFLRDSLGVTKIREGAGLGVKPISEFGTRRLVGAALRHALDKGRPNVTLVHKGNIMKFTEGAFRDWGYQEARENFGDRTVPESELRDEPPRGKVVVKDRIADAMFQQLLLRPDEYGVIATSNLNGDYLSDAAVAQVGGLGFAPGANLSDDIGFFEATHGTAPKYAGQDKVNPGSLILSGVMMLEHLGWVEAAETIPRAIGEAVKAGRVTYDVARQIQGATVIRCSEFAEEIIKRL